MKATNKMPNLPDDVILLSNGEEIFVTRENTGKFVGKSMSRWIMLEDASGDKMFINPAHVVRIFKVRKV